MKASGELDHEDPWGAMDARPEVAAGGSGSSNRAGGADILPPHPALREPSRSPSPDQIPTLTRGKGKGRAGKPEETYASRYGAAEESEHEEEHAAHSGGEDSDDDEVRPPPMGSKPPGYDLGDSDDEGEDEEEEEEEARPARGRKSTRRVEGSSSRGSSSKPDRRRRGSSGESRYSQEEEDGDVPHWGSKPPAGSPPPWKAGPARRDSMDEPDFDDEEDEEVVEVSAGERAKYGIPPNLPMTETKLKIWKKSRASEEHRMSGGRADM